MSFSYETKNELCRLPVQKLCCARAEAYGILLYCNTFSATEVRVITENPNFAERLPKLFRRSFGLSFDRQPDKEQTEGNLSNHRPAKAEPYHQCIGIRSAAEFGIAYQFCVYGGVVRSGGIFTRSIFCRRQHHRPAEALSSGVDNLTFAGEPGNRISFGGMRLSAEKSEPKWQFNYIF